MPVALPETHANPKRSSFEQDVTEVMQRLRRAIAALIDALPARIGTAADLERALGLSTTLAWQLHRLANSTNPLSAVTHVPGSASIKQALRKARKLGIAENRLDEVWRATERFEQLVDDHAGDRGALVTMATALASDESDVIDLPVRRSAFRSNCRIWGMQQRANLRAALYIPGRQSDEIDSISVLGGIDLLRIRPDVSSTLAMHGFFRGEEVLPYEIDPLNADAEGEINSQELLAKFCSQPIPPLRRHRDGDLLITELSQQTLGKTGAFTFFFADVARGLKWQEPDSTTALINTDAVIMKPTETIIIDCLIYEGMFDSIKPSAAAYANAFKPGRQLEPTEQNRLPLDVKVNRLGYGVSCLHTAVYTGYVDVIEHVCQRTGLDADKFEVFRCCVEYPILHSMISLSCQVPNKGNW